MIAIISPAKSLNLEPSKNLIGSKPELLTKANKLVKVMKEKTAEDLKEMMHISDKLALENYLRYKQFKQRPNDDVSKEAIKMFMGDVYRGLNVEDYSKKDYTFAQDHLRILSGLYGILKPMDLIQPYRLEMGSKLITDKGSNLYHYWGDDITSKLNKSLKYLGSDTIVNLASDEYFKAINKKKLKADILSINFKEYRDNKLKFISFSAKVARGLMARYIIKNKIQNREDLLGFDVDGYRFSEENSTENAWVFVR